MRDKLLEWLIKRYGLNWISFNYRMNYGESKIIIAPYLSDKKDDPLNKNILKKEIPLSFLIFVQILHPISKVVARGLITHEDIVSDKKWSVRANSI